MNAAIAHRRLINQFIASDGHRRPAEVVAWCGAVQAQEYEPAKWALGLRMKNGAVNRDVETAFDSGRILRIHVMRPTWHFVTAEDIRWLVELTAPRVQRTMASYNRHLELDARTLGRGMRVFERALRDRQYLTRADLRERLARVKLEMRGQRLAHLALHAELEGVICSGPRRGTKFTYALVAERAPNAARRDREDALGELCKRFLRSHGPATIRDFVWWSGVMTADAKRALEICRAAREEIDGRTYWSLDGSGAKAAGDALVHLLPIYDEYLVAYRDRDAVPHSTATITDSYGKSVTFQHAVVIEGQVAGTWRLGRSSSPLMIHVTALRPLTARERRGLGEAVERYRQFQGVPVAFTVS